MKFAPYLFLMALCLVVYAGSFTHDFLLNWDDTLYVTQNKAIRAVTPGNIATLSTTVYGGNIAPLQMISYMLEHAVWGLNPAGFKGVNILLQALCGITLFSILRTAAGLRNLPALAASALFLIHPVQVETVVWISQRKSLLATLFFLLAFLLYDRITEKGEIRVLTFSWLAFAASLLAKSSGVGLPLLLLARDHCAGVPLRRSLLRVIPFVAIAAAAASLTVYAQSVPGGDGGVVSWHGGSFLSNARLSLSLPASYLGLLLWPLGLSAHYPEQTPGFFSLTLITGVMVITLWITGCITLLKRKNLLSLPLVLIGTAFLPVMQLIPLLPTMNDRYWHLPMAGVTWLVAACLAKLSPGPATAVPRSFRQGTVMTVVCILILTLSVLARNRTAAWSDSVTLWESALKEYPEDPRILLLLGDSWRAYDRYDLAGEFFERSITAGESCDALEKAAGIRMADRSFERARGHLQRMIPVCGPDRKRDGLLLLAESYHAEGRPDEAAVGYETYLQEAPNSFTGHNALGSIYLSLGRYDEAQKHLLRAVDISPPSAARLSKLPLSQLAEIRKRSGRTAEAATLVRALAMLAGHEGA